MKPTGNSRIMAKPQYSIRHAQVALLGLAGWRCRDRTCRRGHRQHSSEESHLPRTRLSATPVDAVITELPPEPTPPPEEEPPPPLRRLMNRLSSQLKSQLLRHGLRSRPPPKPRPKVAENNGTGYSGALATIPAPRATGEVRRVPTTLMKRGAPSRPAAANSSSLSTTVAMQRTSQPSEHREPDSRSDFDQHVHALEV